MATEPVFEPTGRPSWDDYYEPRWDVLCNPLPDFEIDPDSTQRFRFPLAADLDGETIVDAELILEDGLSFSDLSFGDTTISVLLHGANWGGLYRVTVRYTTSDGQVRDKTYRFVTREL